MTNSVRPLEDELREIFGRTAYTHKTHEKNADWLDAWYRFWFWLDIALIAASAGAAIPELAKIYPWAATAFGFAALLVTMYHMKSDAQPRIKQHRATAVALWMLRERLQSTLSDLACGAITGERARTNRDEILGELAMIYHSAPQTGKKAFNAAQKALKQNEELTFSDREIDVMLPASLRRTLVQPRNSPPSK